MLRPMLGCVATGTGMVEVNTASAILLNTLVNISQKCVRLTVQNLDEKNDLEIAYSRDTAPVTTEMAILEPKRAMQFEWASADCNKLYVASPTGNTVKAYVWQEAMI